MKKITHLNDEGQAHMVDISKKRLTFRKSTASGFVKLKKETIKTIRSNKLPKGDMLSIARIAGIMAAKRTFELIPLCHPVMLTKVTIDLKIDKEQSRVSCSATVHTVGQTGVEMEALTAVNVALLTIYDMCKANDKGMIISDVKLLSKTGGKSGEWQRNDT